MLPFFNGLAFGLIFIFSIGPAFFLLIQTSIEKGFKQAVLVAIGISIADILYVVMILKGITSLLENPDVRFWAGVTGVSLLIIFGLFSFFKNPKINTKSENHTPEGKIKSVGTGFLFNLFNPSTVIFWLSLVSIVEINFGYTGHQKLLFFSGVLATILSTDITKSFLAQKLKRFLTLRTIGILNKIVGIILIGFGVSLLTQLF
ncbi:MAG: LysE family translocator [Cyclobacteriaceae bacterium]|nr:LysE family translocator [Cyclobacteriaceae bacterium]